MQLLRRIIHGAAAATVSGLAMVSLVVTASAGSPTSAAAADAPSVPRPDHVVMVMMENHGYDQILHNPSTAASDQDPYIHSLAAGGALLTQSYGITHPSLPNYYALLSASDIVNSSAWPPPSSVDTDNLPNELVKHGDTFADYADQGKPTQWLRYTTTPGTADQLNPMDKRLEDFPSTPAGYSSLPTVSFVVGNGDQSMHDGTIAQGDAWVKSKFGGYIDWARTHNSLFVLTWDEDDFTPVNHIATIFYGPMARAGSYDQKVTHYNVLRTILDMYGLPHINHTADVSTITAPWDLSKTAHIVGAGGRCLENHRTGAADRGGVGMWHCESAADQKWIRRADGTVHIGHRCLATVQGGTANGTRVAADRCDGSSGQQWLPQQNGSLQNPASGRCLAVPAHRWIANGTPPQLQDCTDSVRQKWIVPGFVAPHRLTAGGDRIVEPGATARVTTTYTNDSSPVALRDAQVSLTVPDGWSATATTPRTFSRIAPGQSVRTSWKVTPPAKASPGVDPVGVRATYAGAPAPDTASESLAVPYPSLAAARNNAGISDDSDPAGANLDGSGSSLSAQTLAAAGLTPGASVQHDGITFTWPDTTAGQQDNVLSGGQTIRMSGSGSTIGLIAVSTNGTSSTTGTVTYTDGTSQTFPISISDWYGDTPASGSDLVASLPYRNNDPAGKQMHAWGVYCVTAPLQAGKTVAYLTLPSAGSPGDTHVFAAGIG